MSSSGRGGNRGNYRGRHHAFVNTKPSSNKSISNQEETKTSLSRPLKSHFFPSPEMAYEYASKWCTNPSHYEGKKHVYKFGFSGGTLLYVPPNAKARGNQSVETPELRKNRFLECAHVMMLVDTNGQLEIPGGTPDMKDQPSSSPRESHSSLSSSIPEKATTATAAVHKHKVSAYLQPCGSNTAMREVEEETQWKPVFSRDTTYVYSHVDLYPSHGSGDYHDSITYTCHVGHVHTNITNDRSVFDATLAGYQHTKTDEALGVISVPLFQVGKFGIVADRGKSVLHAMSRPKDILLLAFIHGIFDLDVLVSIAQKASIPNLKEFQDQLVLFLGIHASVARRIGMMPCLKQEPIKDSLKQEQNKDALKQEPRETKSELKCEESNNKDEVNDETKAKSMVGNPNDKSIVQLSSPISVSSTALIY